jgi:hypothetical protein
VNRISPDVMRSVRRTELEASSANRFQFQFARACHALARVMRCLVSIRKIDNDIDYLIPGGNISKEL